MNDDEEFQEAVDSFTASLEEYMSLALKIAAEEISKLDEKQIREMIRSDLDGVE